jgi:hypothetical protein
MIVRTAELLSFAAARNRRMLSLRGGNQQGNQQQEGLAFTG